MITRSKGNVEQPLTLSLPTQIEHQKATAPAVADDGQYQPAVSSFDVDTAHSSSHRSSRSSSSVVAKRLAAQARHATAILQIAEEENRREKKIAEEENRREKKIAQLRIAAERHALAAELAASLGRSSISRQSVLSLNSVHSWVHSLPENFDPPPTSTTAVPTEPVIPEAVGPIVGIQPAEVLPLQPVPQLSRASPDVPPAVSNDRPSHGARTNVHINQGYRNNPLFHNTPPDPSAVPSSSHHCNGDINSLAKAIVSLGHKPRAYDLPLFSGKATDFIALKQTYINTFKSFSSPENVARIRTALRGEAALAVSALALTCTDPEELIRALEERFARPEFIVLEELAAVRALPRLQNDLKDLNLIACRVQNLLAIIKHLGQVEYLYSPELYNTILGKLTPLFRSIWSRYAAERSSSGTKLETLANFLREEARYHTQFGLVSQSFQITSENIIKNKRIDYCNAFRVSHDSGICGFCKESHILAECTKFKNISPDDRMVLVFQSKRCFRCLGNKRHNWRNCLSKRCDIDGCQSFHHRLLHGANMPTSTSMSHQKVGHNSEKVKMKSLNKPLPSVTLEKSLLSVPTLDRNSTYACSHGRSQHKKVLLKVLPVIISGPLGEVETLALLDDGSTATLIDSVIAARIGLNGPEGHIRVQGVGGMIRDDKVNYVNFKIRGRYSSTSYSVLNARAIENLGLAKQAVSFTDIHKYPHLSDIVREVTFDEGIPSVLIGAKDWHLTVARDIKIGTRNQPVATLTLLGWVVHGGLNSKTKLVDFINHADTLDHETSLENLDILVRESFKVEALGVSKYPRSFGPQHQRAIRILDETTRRLPDGRFEVGLPWKDDEPVIPDSYSHALRRLRSLEQKMAKDDKFAEAYRQNVNSLIKKGYAEECMVLHSSLVAEGTTRFWYLPHFAVVHPKKGKLRVVHDAAAKIEGVSLNSLLLTGPDLLQSLLGILLRWREGSVGLMADIREMFPQIKIKEADTDMQRFLWRDGDQDAPVKEFRMSSMIFGAASSPCTAIHLLNKNAQEHATLYPDASKEVQKNTYMDDYVSSVSDVDKAARLARDIIDLHRLAHFEMRGWISNCPEALRLIPPNLLAATSSLSEVPVVVTDIRTLGLLWNVNDDVLSFGPDLPEEVPSTLTKRTALSLVMRMFDPLGILSPITVHGRILLQRTWFNKIGWDEPLPVDILELWQSWYRHLPRIKNLKLPRWYLTSNFDQDYVELHVFADASESAYACVAYWRFVDTRGKIHVSLVAAKARVAPTKPLSIPRLELQAGLLATRLAATINNEHNLKPARRYFWTDSMNVLGWLRTQGRSLKTYVANRVGEISEETKIEEWRWVPSALNAADDATRINEGVSKRWLQGPSFLFLAPDAWPSEVSSDLSEECLQEFKAPVTIHATTDIPPSPRLLPTPIAAEPSRFSSWLRMVRATARAYQYIQILYDRLNSKINTDRSARRLNRNYHRSPSPSNFIYHLKPLEAEDLLRAEQDIIRQSQREAFPAEFEALRKYDSIERRSRLWRFSPYLDAEGIIRLRGRIDTADVPVSSKRPIVLDGRHKSVRLLLAHFHKKAAHAHPSIVINEVRQRFWILRLRATVRSIALRCAWCVLHKSKSLSPPIGDLPPERLAHHRRPFTYVGLDYMGPVLITIGRRHEKRYIALFTCMTARAIHLELVASLSTDSALMALKRFIARRGTPTKIFSDNGTAFVGANNILKAMAEAGANSGISWSFQPPSAPHMSGVWERLVRSVKNALRAMLRDRAPKEELLHTALLESEALVNSRPLTNVPMDPEALEALTPFHFILGSSSPYHPIPTNVDNGDLLSRSDWRKSQRLADMFWGRWVKEYLPSLLPRGSSARAQPSIAIGDVVLVVDPSLPRGTWPRGRVTKVFPGRDGVVRVAEISTAGGCLRRPLTKLVQLMVSPN